jgi:peptidylprolyl isomerase domain and WD repeat-containing protein 1
MADEDNETHKDDVSKRPLPTTELSTPKKQKTSSKEVPKTSSSSSSSRNRIEFPCSQHYHVSWMHATIVTCIAVSKPHGFVLSADTKGIVKFWKRKRIAESSTSHNVNPAAAAAAAHPCLEFVKRFTAHAEAVQCLTIDPSGDFGVSVSRKSMQFYDVRSFDAVRRMALPKKNTQYYCRVVAAWFTLQGSTHLAVSSGSQILIYRPDQIQSNNDDPIQIIQIHAAPITCLLHIPRCHMMISTDQAGIIDLWDTSGETKPMGLETNGDDETALWLGGPCNSKTNGIVFDSKLSTNLYKLVQGKTYAIAAAASPTHFALYTHIHKLYIFDIPSCKIVAKFDETVASYAKVASQLQPPLDDFDYRANVEKEIQTESHVFGTKFHFNNLENPSQTNVVDSEEEGLQQALGFAFDETGQYILLPCLLGIKVLDWQRRIIRGVVGRAETGLRFVNMALATGKAVTDTQMELALGGGGTTVSSSEQQNVDDALAKKQPLNDTLILALAYNQRRIYVFSHVDLDDGESLSRRDVFNEAPSAMDQLVLSSLSKSNANAALPNKAILRTTKGDIHIQLFPALTPKTVENFVGHAKSGYFDGVIFHRVIKGFMIQTGDPLGDGTGGESIWGGEFEDEIVNTLKHDRPFTVSMANSGPNTNGSQFFITTVPTPWLDSKHTVFGRVVKGADVCSIIENVKTDDNDKPLDEIRIHNVDVES